MTWEEDDLATRSIHIDHFHSVLQAEEIWNADATVISVVRKKGIIYTQLSFLKGHKPLLIQLNEFEEGQLLSRDFSQ
jgi:hypothetical protein